MGAGSAVCVGSKVGVEVGRDVGEETGVGETVGVGGGSVDVADGGCLVGVWVGGAPVGWVNVGSGAELQPASRTARIRAPENSKTNPL